MKLDGFKYFSYNLCIKTGVIMFITTIEIVAKGKKEEMEKKLKSSDVLAEFDIEELDKNDDMKNILLSFNNPIDVKYVSQAVTKILE